MKEKDRERDNLDVGEQKLLTEEHHFSNNPQCIKHSAAFYKDSDREGSEH